MKRSNLCLLLSLLLLMSGCALKGLFSKDHVLTSADGSTHRVMFPAGDYSKQMQGHERINSFSLTDHKRIYKEGEQHVFQELTVDNLKQIAQQNQFTLMASWNPSCNPSYQAEVFPFLKMMERLLKQGIKFREDSVAFVLASVTYDIPRMDNFFSRTNYPFQTYIIPAGPYHKMRVIKEIRFNKELMPEVYETEKDDIYRYSVFLLNNEGKVIEKVASDGRYPERFSTDLAKLEQKILVLTSKETAQQ